MSLFFLSASKGRPPCKLFATLSRCARYAPAIQSLRWLTYLSQLVPGLRTFTSSFTSSSSIVLACLALGRIQHVCLSSLISLTYDTLSLLRSYSTPKPPLMGASLTKRTKIITLFRWRLQRALLTNIT
jgi:hypothetical protein